jgi:hypothetical protein
MCSLIEIPLAVRYRARHPADCETVHARGATIPSRFGERSESLGEADGHAWRIIEALALLASQLTCAAPVSGESAA